MSNHPRSSLYSRVAQEQAARDAENKKAAAAAGVTLPDGPTSKSDSKPVAGNGSINGSLSKSKEQAKPPEPEPEDESLPVWLRKTVVKKTPSFHEEPEDVFKKKELKTGGSVPRWLETDPEAKAMHANAERPSYHTATSHLESHSLDDPLAAAAAGRKRRTRSAGSHGSAEWSAGSPMSRQSSSAAGRAQHNGGDNSHHKNGKQHQQQLQHNASGGGNEEDELPSSSIDLLP